MASGLSGPRRAFSGAVRDNLLGVKLINGRGQILSFGGQVMKNVAGYDLSRINAGALGTLGVLLEVSLKVLPRPAFERTAVFEMDEATALARLTALGRTSLSITATAHDGERLYVRVCGGERSLEAAEQVLDGQTLPESRDFWHSVREHSHPFFDRPGPLWRLSLPPAAPSLGLGRPSSNGAARSAGYAATHPPRSCALGPPPWVATPPCSGDTAAPARSSIP